MAPASPISTTTTLLRQSVVVSPSDRFRAAGSVESPTWVVVHQKLAADSKSPRRHSIPPTTFRFYRYAFRSKIGRRCGELPVATVPSADLRFNHKYRATWFALT